MTNRCRLTLVGRMRKKQFGNVKNSEDSKKGKAINITKFIVCCTPKKSSSHVIVTSQDIQI